MLTGTQDEFSDIFVLGKDFVFQLIQTFQDVLVSLPLMLQLKHSIVQSFQQTQA